MIDDSSPAIGDLGRRAIDDSDRPAILFVDDEAEVLAGLRTSLRRLRGAYHLHFANSGDDALALLAERRIDVVVSDMRMPGMNGVELLTTVQARFPNVIRCILSGEAEQELVIRAIPVTHRWLTKPCGRDELAAALSDAVRHRTLLADPDLGLALGGAMALPSAPQLYGALLELLADRDVSIERVADLVGEDPAISAKLLQWANSAFSAGQPVTDIKTAVVRIGLSAVSQLVLLAEVIGSFEASGVIPGMDVDTFKTHVAMISRLAAGLSPPETAPEAHLGGLFSSVGLLLEAGYLPSRIEAAYSLAVEDEIALLEAERRLYGIGHPELGAYLLSMWGLPSDLVLLARCSNDLPESPHPTPTGRRSLQPIEAVRFARLLAQQGGHAEAIGSPHLDRLDDELMDAVSGWRAVVEAREGLAS